FALPGDELARAREAGGLHRNFMGYTTHDDTDLVGLGVSAISRIADSFSQNHRDLPAWEAALDAGKLPVWRGLALSGEDQLRNEVIQQLMCRGEIGVGSIERRFGIDFADHFADALARLDALREDGLVEVEAALIRATARGRLLLRIIAMCFDAYLPPTVAPSSHSRAI